MEEEQQSLPPMVLNYLGEAVSEEILDMYPDLVEKSEAYWRQIWKQNVPSVFLPPLKNKGVEYEYNKEDAEERLFKPMRMFLSGNQDPDEFLKVYRLQLHFDMRPVYFYSLLFFFTVHLT